MESESAKGSYNPAFLTSRKRVLQDAPHFTAVVCTHERPEGLRLCLESLLAQNYPNFSIIVVDNAPNTDRSRLVVDAIASPIIKYVVEPQKGLSWARNRALQIINEV